MKNNVTYRVVFGFIVMLYSTLVTADPAESYCANSTSAACNAYKDAMANQQNKTPEQMYCSNPSSQACKTYQEANNPTNTPEAMYCADPSSPSCLSYQAANESEPGTLEDAVNTNCAGSTSVECENSRAAAQEAQEAASKPNNSACAMVICLMGDASSACSEAKKAFFKIVKYKNKTFGGKVPDIAKTIKKRREKLESCDGSRKNERDIIIAKYGAVINPF